MPVSATTLRRLAALGLAPDAMAEILSIIADIEAPHEERRARDAARKLRGKSADNPRNIQGASAENPLPRVSARAEPKITNSSVPIQKNKKQTDSGASALSVLVEVLDEDRAKAVIEHRRRMGKGKALTAHSAQLLADRLRACPDPNAAADEMIVRGWMSVKADWMQPPANGPPGRAPAPTAKTELPKWEGPFDGYRTAAERDQARNGEVLRRGHGVHRDDEEGDGEGSLFGDQAGHR